MGTGYWDQIPESNPEHITSTAHTHGKPPPVHPCLAAETGVKKPQYETAIREQGISKQLFCGLLFLFQWLSVRVFIAS